MNQEDREIYRERYVKRLGEYGHDPRSLGWTKGKQAERFTALTSRVDLSKISSVLDVGCGFGDLYPFLTERGFAGRYVGVDFVEELVEVGRKAYPGADLRVGDVDDFAEGEHDLVVASGIFNGVLAHATQWDHIEHTLGRMAGLCTFACAADFMSSYVDYRRDDTFYAEPERVFSIAKGLSRRVVMLHDYLPFEFSVWLFAEDQVQDGARFAPLLKG